MSKLPECCKECGQTLTTKEQGEFAADLRRMLREARVEIRQKDAVVSAFRNYHEIKLTGYTSEENKRRIAEAYREVHTALIEHDSDARQQETP